MPKKSSKDNGESRKRRSSSKDVRNSANALAEDGLLPPTPSASHLFASNPFDDPPPSNVINGSGSAYPGQPRMLMHGPLHAAGLAPNYIPKGPPSQPPWKPVMSSPLRAQHGHYDSPLGGPVWRPNSGEMPPRMIHPTAYHTDACMVPHPDFNRPVVGGQVPCRPPVYHGAPMSNNSRDEQAFVRQKLDNQPLIRQNSSNAQKSNPRKFDKILKTDQASWSSKPKRRARQSDFPAKSGTPKVDEKDWISELAGTENKTHLSPPLTGDSLPPHSIPPTMPQTCFQCGKDIKYPAEDCICCLASCKSWYHRICTGLSEAAHACLKGEELALWACDNCLCVKEIDSVRIRNAMETHGCNANRSITPAKA